MIRFRPQSIPFRLLCALSSLLIGTLGCQTVANKSAFLLGRTGKSGVVIVNHARFTIETPECIRMEYSPQEHFIDAPSPFATSREGVASPSRATHATARITLDTGRIRLEYIDDGKPFGQTNLRATIRKGEGNVQWRPGMHNEQNLGGPVAMGSDFATTASRGVGLLARDGWYCHDDSWSPLLKEGAWVPRPAGYGQDWYLFGYGEDFKGALRALAAVGGRVPMPPRYALGAWYVPTGALTSGDYRQIVQDYAANDFPLDVLVMDKAWQRPAAVAGLSWNRGLIHDPPELLGWLHGQGVRTMLSLPPVEGIAPGEDAYAPFMKALGAANHDPASTRTLAFEAASPKRLAAFFDQVIAPLRRQGVDGWRVDGPAPTATSHSLKNAQPFPWLSEGLHRDAARGGRRELTLGGWADWGDHRSPTHFLGDAAAPWPGSGAEVPLTAAAGNAGCFYWSPDASGFMGGNDEESYARWAQLACLSPVLRADAASAAQRDRLPWKSSPPVVASLRRFEHLRCELFPYIYTSAWEGWRDALPLVRPMYLQYAASDEAYDNPQQYLFGDNLLCAPIAQPGVGPGKVAWQRVWFPAGTWFNLLTGERQEGDRTAVAVADLSESPIFVRAGVPIPMQPYRAHLGAAALDELPAELIVRAWPGADQAKGYAQLYEDDGLSLGYRQGRSATTTLGYARAGDRVTVTIAPTVGSFAGQSLRRAYAIELPATAAPGAATIDGRPAPAEYDAATFTTRVRVAARSIRRGVRVVVEASDADQSAIRGQAFRRRMESLAPGRDFQREGMFSEADMQSGVAEAIAALFGVAVVENDALYPTRDLLRRVVSTGPRESFPVTGVRVDYSIHRMPSDTNELRRAAQLTDDATVGGVEPPPGTAAPGASESVEVSRILSFQVNGGSLSIRRPLTKQRAGGP